MSKKRKMQRRIVVFALALAFSLPPLALAQQTPSSPPSGNEVFPLDQVHAGLRATAWTVFRGTVPEPMDVEILGVLRGARGPGQDMILAQLHGSKPEYTGVVAGMSGSPVYVGGKLLGALAYRIGQFSKDPIAGITPIEQMLAVRDLPLTNGAAVSASEGKTLTPMETPLAMSGFSAEAIRFWQQQMAGTGLETVMAAGMGSQSAANAQPAVKILPGSAVSAQLVRGDVEIAATCTVTFIDAKQLLACGHPLMQSGSISLPMTATAVVLSLASPLNAFKIVNTGAEIGAFTEDRSSAIRGELGAKARMIPMQIEFTGKSARKPLRVEILDQQGLTPQAAEVVLLQALQQTIGSTAETSYHVTGSIQVEGFPAFPIDLWATPSERASAPMAAVLQLGERLDKIYSNRSRQMPLQKIDLSVNTMPRQAQLQLISARLLEAAPVHAGDLVEAEVTLLPWQQSERKMRLKFQLPARLSPGHLQILVSGGKTIESLRGMRAGVENRSGLETILAEARAQLSADRVYVTLLMPEAQAEVEGQPLTNLPLSVTNALEPMRSAREVSLHGESAGILADFPVDGPISGFKSLPLHIAPGSGLN